MWEFHGSQLVELGVGARARTEADLKNGGDATACASGGAFACAVVSADFDAGPHAPSGPAAARSRVVACALCAPRARRSADDAAIYLVYTRPVLIYADLTDVRRPVRRPRSDHRPWYLPVSKGVIYDPMTGFRGPTLHVLLLE